MLLFYEFLVWELQENFVFWLQVKVENKTWKIDVSSTLFIWCFIFVSLITEVLFSLCWFVLKFILFQAGSRNIDLELTTLSSANHVELSPSDAGFQDRYVVQEVIKEMAKNRPIDTKGKRGFKGNFFWMICYAIIYEWTSFPDDDDDNNYCDIFIVWEEFPLKIL